MSNRITTEAVMSGGQKKFVITIQGAPDPIRKIDILLVLNQMAADLARNLADGTVHQHEVTIPGRQP